MRESSTYLDLLAGAVLDPLLALLPRLVERAVYSFVSTRVLERDGAENAQEASLATALDELIGLDDELVGEDPVGKSGVGGDLVGLRVPRDLHRGGSRASACC